jgi:hypothetical protein
MPWTDKQSWATPKLGLEYMLEKLPTKYNLSATSHEFIFNYLFNFFNFFNDILGYIRSLVSIHRSLYPGVQITCRPEKNYKQIDQKKI